MEQAIIPANIVKRKSVVTKVVFAGCCQNINKFETEFKDNNEYKDISSVECKKLLAQLYLLATGSDGIDVIPLRNYNKKNPIDRFSKISSEYLKEEERGQDNVSASLVGPLIALAIATTESNIILSNLS